MKKTLSIIAMVLLVSSLFAGSALAAGTVLHGRGRLHAAGKGVAKIVGHGTVKVKGKGILVVSLLSDDATAAVHGYGHKRVVSPTTTVYYGYNGRAKVSGSRIKVKVIGRSALSAAGKGTAFLKGHGRYHVGHLRGSWTPRGVSVSFEK